MGRIIWVTEAVVTIIHTAKKMTKRQKLKTTTPKYNDLNCQAFDQYISPLHGQYTKTLFIPIIFCHLKLWLNDFSKILFDLFTENNQMTSCLCHYLCWVWNCKITTQSLTNYTKYTFSYYYYLECPWLQINEICKICFLIERRNRTLVVGG